MFEVPLMPNYVHKYAAMQEAQYGLNCAYIYGMILYITTIENLLARQYSIKFIQVIISHVNIFLGAS